MPRDILKFPCGEGPCVERVEATWSRPCWAHYPQTTGPTTRSTLGADRERARQCWNEAPMATTKWVKNFNRLPEGLRPPRRFRPSPLRVFRRPCCGLKAGSLPPLRNQCLLQWLLVTLTSTPWYSKGQGVHSSMVPFFVSSLSPPKLVPVVTVRR